MIVDRAKYWVAGHVKRSPRLWPLSWELARRLPLVLPHDKSYYGFCHFAKPNGGQFLDIGANNGVTALGIHKILPNYAITSVEADPSHQPALEHVKRHIPRFDYHIIGASDEKRETMLYLPRVNGSLIHALASTDLDYIKVMVARDFGKTRAKKVEYERRLIRTSPLDELGVYPDLVKIDVEGHELPTLRGFDKTISEARPVISLEFTPYYFMESEKFLRKRGYEFLAYNRDSDAFKIFDTMKQREEWSNLPLQVNVFCVPGERLLNDITIEV